MLEPMHARPTVAILGGDPVVGKALKSLLESTDQGVRFFSDHLDEFTELPGEVEVALVMPALSTERRDALITRLKSASGKASLPIIELITTPNGHPNGHRIYVALPCSVEELKGSIEVALVRGSQAAV